MEQKGTWKDLWNDLKHAPPPWDDVASGTTTKTRTTSGGTLPPRGRPSAPERIADRAHGLRRMGRVVEGIGWLNIGLGVLFFILKLAVRPGDAATGAAMDPVGALLTFVYFAFGALVLLIIGRAVALFAEHVAMGVGADLDDLPHQPAIFPGAGTFRADADLKDLPRPPAERYGVHGH